MRKYKPTEDRINQFFCNGVPVKQVIFLRDELTPTGGHEVPSGCNMQFILMDGTTLTIESEITTEITLEKP